MTTYKYARPFSSRCVFLVRSRFLCLMGRNISDMNILVLLENDLAAIRMIIDLFFEIKITGHIMVL